MPVTLFGLVELFGQRLEVQDLAVVALLVVLEGMLSIDNALVLGLLAKRLPKHEQAKALWYGLAGAFLFRFFAVLMASLLLRWTFAKFLGGAYLVYIAVRHLFFESADEDKDKIVLDDQGHPVLVDEETGGPLSEPQEEHEIGERVPVYISPEKRKSLGLAAFWPTVLVIELTDIAFAVDSILAAIAMIGSAPPGTPPGAFHPKLWVVVFGGIIGLMLMRVAARMFIQLLERFPRFEISAYLLVIVIGLKLLADWGVNSDWSFNEPKWLANRMGAMKAPFEKFEQRRRGWIHSYEDWLRDDWILGLAPGQEQADEKHADGQHAGENANEKPAAGGDEQPGKQPNAAIPHTPHLLDFHSPRRPEFIVFWSLMVICFLIGFWPKKQVEAHA